MTFIEQTTAAKQVAMFALSQEEEKVSLKILRNFETFTKTLGKEEQLLMNDYLTHSTSTVE